MDKYRREDDMNDDLEVYRGETYDGMHISSFKHQKLSTRGKKEEQEISFGALLYTLSPKQMQLYKLVVEHCLSIREAAKKMNIRQQTAQEYWEIIKEKMQ